MKTITTAFLFIVLSISASAQIVGVDFATAQNIAIDTSVKYETLTFSPELNSYAIIFAQTPVGLKHCMYNLTSLLRLNGLDIEHPDINETLLASNVSSIFDYENLDLSIKANKSEVDKFWKLANGWVICILLQADSYCIVFTPQKTTQP